MSSVCDIAALVSIYHHQCLNWELSVLLEQLANRQAMMADNMSAAHAEEVLNARSCYHPHFWPRSLLVDVL